MWNKIDNSDSNTQTDVSSDYEKNKRYALIGIGYLTVLILLISVLSAWYNVKVINADRLLLYPVIVNHDVCLCVTEINQ